MHALDVVLYVLAVVDVQLDATGFEFEKLQSGGADEGDDFAERAVEKKWPQRGGDALEFGEIARKSIGKCHLNKQSIYGEVD